MKMRMGTTCVVAAMLCASGAAFGSEDRTDGGFVEIPGVQEFSGRMTLRPVQLDEWYARGLTKDEAEARMDEARALAGSFDLVEYVWQTDEYHVLVADGMDENTMSALVMGSGLFQYADPDWNVWPAACPNDSRFAGMWRHRANRMNSCAGWDLHTGNDSVGVGICDTGVRTTHEDLLLHRRMGYNAVNRLWENQGGQINDINGHGTFTTGMAAANGNNGRGVVGTGWDLSHRMLRVSNSSGGGSSLSTLNHAARVSVENGDKVASVSYSGVNSGTNRSTATYIKGLGGLLVWAAGNDGSNLNWGNRDADDIIVVGSTNSNDTRSGFSNFGPSVDFMAPGEAVLSTVSSSNTAYGTSSGTSFACPAAAGLAALLFSYNPALTPDQVERAIKEGCDDLGQGGVDNTYGYGRIDVRGALDRAAPPPPDCYADCDGNGSLDIRDFFCFQAAFAAREPYADCDGNSTFDIRDFFCFQASYAGGCP